MKFSFFPLLFALCYIFAINQTPVVALPIVIWGGFILFGVLAFYIMNNLDDKMNDTQYIVFILSGIIIIGTFIYFQSLMVEQQNEFRSEFENIQSLYKRL